MAAFRPCPVDPRPTDRAEEGNAPPPGVPARAMLRLIRVYKRWLSPILPQGCRYEPTCSDYMAAAIRRRGFLRGTLKGIWRLCRCHPLARGGWDPVDPADQPTYLGKTTLEPPPTPEVRKTENTAGEQT